MTDTLIVAALVGFTLSALTGVLGGAVWLALAVLVAGMAAAIALVLLLSRPSPDPAARTPTRPSRNQRLARA